MYRRLLALSAVGAALLTFAAPLKATAQQFYGGMMGGSPGRTYQPAAGGPISPYMNFFRNDRVGPLGNYNAFVRPTLNLQSTLQQQNQFLLQQQREIGQLGAQLQPGALQQPIAPTGTAARFMDYQHYYPSMPRR